MRNDNNIVVDGEGQVTGLIDFGDMTYGRQINELAVTLAYALLDVEDVYKSAAPLIGAYAKAFPLDGDEADVLFDLVAARLAASVCISSHRAKDFPDNAYLLVSQAPAFRLLERLDQTNPAFLAAFARHAAGLDPVPSHDAVVSLLSSSACKPAPMFDLDLNRNGRILLSLNRGAPGMEHAGDPVAYWNWLEQRSAAEDACFGIGLYGEDRDVYKGDQFRTAASPEWRSQHLGIDIFIAADTPLYAPLDGRVLSAVDNDLPFDYGPTVILEHRAGENGPVFWTLYGHLSREDALDGEGRHGGEGRAADRLDRRARGQWRLGAAPAFPDHHGPLNKTGEFHGVGQPSLWPLWSRIAPDPNLILRLAPESYVEDRTRLMCC